jgi:4-alpha-glucanotransferase
VTSDDLAPDAYGVHRRWIDADAQLQDISPATVQRLHDAIGEPPPDLEARTPIVTRPGLDPGLGTVEVRLEDGSSRTIAGRLPADFPLGYHEVDVGGHTRRLIVSPGRCWLPEGWRAWGWTAQLYAARSRSSWGMGDLGDLRALRQWAEDLDAGFLMVNPLHAVALVVGQESSPYLPATRRFRNPLYIRIDDVPGAADVDVVDLRERAERLNAADRIDRDSVWELKREALSRLFARRGDDGFDAWRRQQGRSLQEHAVWSVLTGSHGPDWHSWPEPLRSPTSGDVAAFAQAHADEVSFHAWLQWLLEQQLRQASGELPVLQDLPIGVDGAGLDAWAWQQQLATGISVGAPPDQFNAAGQTWGSPPFIPWRLRLDGYAAFIESIRSTMASAGGLRIDHVMGLFRLWWVPGDGDPTDGAYVRYPSADLLDIVALESVRAQALVVGEDLGTVEPGVREELAEHAILSYRLLLFEADDPSTWPVSAMAAVTTHDLPTVAGLVSGADMDDQAARGLGDEESRRRDRHALLQALLGDAHRDGLNAEEAITAAYTMLARAPSVLVSASLEDAVADVRRPNMPGTTDASNWSRPLPVLVDDLPAHRGAAALAALLRKAVKRSAGQAGRGRDESANVKPMTSATGTTSSA